ncbi:hypothetical protein EGW08_004674, partial [Elysia chlorotica]
MTTQEEIKATTGSDKDATKPMTRTTETTTSSTVTETTPDSTDATTQTTEPPNNVPIPTTATTTMSPQTTETSTTVTTPPPPILGGPCTSIDQLGNESPRQLCEDVVGAGCFDVICQCKKAWYRLRDSCEKRDLDDTFQLTLKSEDKTSIGVSWRELELSHSFDLFEYKVSWRELSDVSTGSAFRNSQNVRSMPDAAEKQTSDQTSFDIDDENTQVTNETTAVIPKLTPGSRYWIAVKALIQVKDTGRMEDLWYPPGMYRLEPNCLSWSDNDVTLFQRNRTMLITFQRPEGTFNKCLVNVQGEGFSESDCQTFSVSSFEYGVTYKVITKVTAGTTDEKSCEATTTLTRESKRPEKVCKLEVSKVTGEAFTLTWEPPCEYHGYVTSYQVTLQSRSTCKVYKFVDSAVKEIRSLEEQSGSVAGDKTDRAAFSKRSGCSGNTTVVYQPIFGPQSYTFKELHVDTLYRVTVSASNEKGGGQETEKEVKTTSIVPNKPGDFQGYAIGLSEVHLIWTPPEPYPGPTDYEIYEFMVSQWDARNSPRSPFATITVEDYTSDSFTITKLRPATTYKFEIVAKTSAGQSEAAQTGPLQTWERQSPPVIGLKVTDETFDSMHLTWRAPSQGNGDTRAYVIVVRTAGGECVQAFAIVNYKTEMGPQQSNVPSLFEAQARVCPGTHPFAKLPYHDRELATALTLSELEPDTQYNILVAAYNGAGLGQSAEVQGKTKNAVPNAPTQFTCSGQSAGRGTLYLSWRPPTPRPGDTTYEFIVLVADDYSGRTFSNYKRYTLKGYNQNHYYVKQLRHYWHYRALLTAITPAGSSTQVKTEICRTLPAAPGLVSKASVQYNYQNHTELEIEWGCPRTEDRHGILEYFLLKVAPKSTTRTDIKLAEIHTKSVEITVRNNNNGSQDCSTPYTAAVRVVPQVTYVVSIRAKVKTVDEFGAVYEKSIYAPSAAPPLLPKPVRKEKKNDNQQPFTFTTIICPTCLVNSVFGQPTRYGLGVCLEGFCDVASRTNQSLKDYEKLASWNISKAAQFKIPFQIFDTSWKKMILAESQANHVSVEFTVGNQSSCTKSPSTEFCNGPLPPGRAFRVFQFSCTLAGCTESDLSDATVTAAAVSTPSSDSLVMGGAASGVAVALIIILIIVVVRIRFRKVVQITEKEADQDMQLSDITTPLPDVVVEKS